jgi:Protein of unknown function (DUF2798)
MLPIPRRYSHFVFGIIQSGLTSALAAAVASYPFLANDSFVDHWLAGWFIAWGMMLPIVLFAAPFIRRLSDFLTRDESSKRLVDQNGNSAGTLTGSATGVSGRRHPER